MPNNTLKFVTALRAFTGRQKLRFCRPLAKRNVLRGVALEIEATVESLEKEVRGVY